VEEEQDISRKKYQRFSNSIRSMRVSRRPKSQKDLLIALSLRQRQLLISTSLSRKIKVELIRR
jgi:hypothetical protein